MQVLQPLTREDLRDELNRFAVDTLRQELHLFLLEWLQAPPAAPSAAKPPTQLPEALCSEESSAANSTWRELRAKLGVEARPREEGSAANSTWRELRAKLGVEADTEASPRPASRLASEAVQGSLPAPSRPSLEPLDDQETAESAESAEGAEDSQGISSKVVVPSMRAWQNDSGHRANPRGSWFHRHYRQFVRSSSFPRRSPQGTARRTSVWSSNRKPRVQPMEGNFITRMVFNPLFDYATGLLILANAASIGLQTDYMARNISDEVPAAFRGMEITFCTVFTLELLLRICVYRMRIFRSPEWLWNIFDIILVALQLSEEIVTVWLKASQVDESVNTDFSMMRILRILRLIRIIRLVRILRLIGELRTIVVSIAGSLRSLCWTVLLLMMMMYLVGVYLTQLVSDNRVALQRSQPHALPSQASVELAGYFGSLGSAMLTLYQSITGGLNWHAISDPLVSDISPWLSVLLGLYIAFSLFALMNVVTGVFVENALATSKRDRDSFLLHFVRKLFQEADKDASGAITWDEFKACLGSKEMQMYFEAFDLDIHEAKNLFHLLDLNGSGEVDFDEFVNGCFRLRGQAKALDLATFMTGFSEWSSEWLSFAKRVDWQLRTVLKQMDISTADAPKFAGESTSKRCVVGMTLNSPRQSVVAPTSSQESAEGKEQTDPDNRRSRGKFADDNENEGSDELKWEYSSGCFASDPGDGEVHPSAEGRWKTGAELSREELEEFPPFPAHPGSLKLLPKTEDTHSDDVFCA